jgi:peptidoglycan/LPS O-acetylase OafA/YrhL
MFFVLSGYLITRILLSTKSSARYFRSFYVRRLLRIFPLYYAVLLGTIVILPRFIVHTPAIDALLHRQVLLWTFTMNYEPLAFGAGPIVLLHFWSLAVEEQFYLLWPAVVFLANRKRLRWICYATIVAAPLLRLTLLLLGDPLAPYFITPCRADALAFGALIAVESIDAAGASRLTTIARRSMAPLTALMAALTIFGMLNVVPQPMLVPKAVLSKCVSLTVVGAFFAALLVLLLNPDGGWRWIRSAFSNRVLRWVGKYSYGIYIFHFTLTPVAHRAFASAGLDRIANPFLYRLAYFLIASALSIAAAYVSWHLMEKRFLRLKKYFSAATDKQS